MNRRGGGGSSTGSNRPRKIPQFPQKKPATVPPSTPIQPGAPPSSPLGLIAAGFAGLLLLYEWARHNFRSGSDVESPPTGPVMVAGGADTVFKVRWAVSQRTTGIKNCSSGASRPDETDGPNPQEVTVWGAGYEVLTGSVTDKQLCGFGVNVSPTSVPYWRLIQANGSSIPQNSANNGRIVYSGDSGLSAEAVTTFGSWGHVLGGVFTDTMIRARAQDPATPQPGPIPIVPAAVPQSPLSPAATGAGAPSLTPAGVPDASPVPVPAPVPGGLPAGQPSTPPVPATAPRVTRTVTRSTPGSLAQGVTATGPVQQPVTPIVPVTPVTAVIIGGQTIGGPALAPPANLEGMAQELGRLERKAEMTLDRLGPLANLPDVIDALADLVDLIDRLDPGGSYSIRPACGTDANGDPLPVIEVPIAPGLGLAHAVTARLDAIAELIDHHKQLRQPVCKGKPTGQPVTVTALEVE